MRALIIDDLRRKGGGQTYARATAKVLEQIGYDTYFLTNVSSGPSQFQKVAYQVSYSFVENSNAISDLFKILRLRRQLQKVNTKEFDITINNHPNVFIKRGDINILHGFSFLDQWVDENGNIISPLPPKFLKLLNLYNVYNQSFFSPNSSYTKEISSKLFQSLGLEVTIGEVLYPPIPVRENNLEQKKNQVLLLGRISPYKGIEEAVSAASHGLFKMTIAGYVNQGDEAFVERLKKRVGQNVRIMTNINEDEKDRLMRETSTILSLNKKEHFGIAIAEGMSFGCVPVVPRFGGQWVDIAEKGKYGMGYATLDDLEDTILKSFDYGLDERKKIVRSINRFSLKEFEKKLRETMAKVNASRSLLV